MTKTRWRHTWRNHGRSYSTADAGVESLTSRADGIMERAENTADNAIMALCRLVETLHDKGVLNSDEVRQVLELHAYEPVEDR